MSGAHPVFDADDELPCRASVDELLEQVSADRADHRDEHQQHCPHCQATLAEYDRLWAPVREVARTEVTAPDAVLVEAIARIREVASDPTYGIITSPDGTVRVAARVVVVVARETAQAVAGVRVVLGRLVTAGMNPAADTTPAGRRPPAGGAGGAGVDGAESADTAFACGARVVAGVSGTSTAVEVTLAADYGTDLIALGERIRAELDQRIRALTGLEPVVVTVHIDDVFE